MLREQLGPTGTKYGRGVAQCGACTVLIDGVPTRSCVRPVSTVEPQAKVVRPVLQRRPPAAEGLGALDVPQCGELIEIRATLGHPMETGYRPDADGKLLPRDIVTSFTCTFEGQPVCRVQHQRAAPQGPDGGEVLALSAYLGARSRGLPLQPGAGPEMSAWQARGEALWTQRLGQLNLACLHCHDQRAGARLGGATIPQGHATGYPAYRLEWQDLGSLQRRLRNCITGVRAEPWPPGADEWLALEVYLAKRAAGLRVDTPAVRP